MVFISRVRSLVFQFGLLTAVAGLVSAQSPCDLNKNGTVDIVDVQLGTNMYLGLATCTANIAGAGVCSNLVVQQVINAALGGTCVTAATHTVALVGLPAARRM